MKRLFKVTVLLFLMVLVSGAFIAPQVECAERYKWINSTATSSTDLDTVTFAIRVKKPMVYFDSWLRNTYSQQGIIDTIASRKRNGLSVEGYENLSHSLHHVVFALNPATVEMKYMFKAIIDYAKDGTVLDNTTIDSPNYVAIPPESVAEAKLAGILEYAHTAGIQPTE